MYYNTKADVDKHVEGCLKSVKSETERDLRCFSFAKLYFNVGDYEQARRYLLSYLSIKPASAEGQKLLGKILEKLRKPEAAFEAYRSSLEIDPSQQDCLLKVCELLASNEINLDRSGARYFCEKAQSIDPGNPIIFSLKERILAAESNDHNDVTKLLLKELELRPADVKLRVRLLKHLLQNNQIKEAYTHAVAIEEKNFSVFINSLVWYETLTDVLIRYQRNCSKLTWEYWVLLVSALDRLVTLSLDNNSENIKNCAEYVTTVFNFDQTLINAFDCVQGCSDRHFVQEFIDHYSAQLCFHFVTLLYKQARKDVISFKDAYHLSLPLLFVAYNAQPSELQSLWLNQLTETRRAQVQSWHREASFRCSQTGHMLLYFAKGRKSTISEKAAEASTGLWREHLFKTLFFKRDQKMKMKSSYFVSSTRFVDIPVKLPEINDVLKYDEEAQLIHPDSLHHYIWIGLNHKLSKFKCIAFEGLPYSVKNLSNCAAETLNILDIESFVFCATLCSKVHIDDLKHKVYYNADKPSVLPASVTDQLGTLNQAKWLSAAYRMYKNEPGADFGDVRLTLIKGIEVVRCVGYHGLDVKLLVLLANIFSERSKHLTKQSEIDFNDARASLYWKTALPLLEKLKNNQAISYSSNRLFEYSNKEMPLGEVYMHIEEGNLFNAVQLMKQKEFEKALKIFETLKDPYASFYQAQIYKKMADEQTSQNKENVTSEMRSQNIILLTNAKDCLYLTLDRLREPTVDKKHPLNAQIGTEIEKIECLLSRIDPDCSNRNECDGMSDENLSSASNTGNHYIPNYSFHTNNYLNEVSAPRHDSYVLNSTPYLMESPIRREAKPCVQRLDAQLRQLAASKDIAINHISEQIKMLIESNRSVLDSIANLTATVDDLKTVKHIGDDIKDIKKSIQELSIDEQNVRSMTDMIYEMKKELNDLKKDNKTKNNQLSDEDLYVLDDEYGTTDYNINSNVTGFNPALYPNYQGRISGNSSLAYGAPALYPGMYHPMAAYHYAGLGLPQPGALPFGAEQQLGADFRAIGQLSQGVNQLPQNFSQPGLNASVLSNQGLTQSALGQISLLNQQVANQATNLLKDQRLDTNLSGNTSTSSVFSSTVSQTYPSVASSSATNTKAPPVNVVITASDPLPTAKSTASQPILSVTIPPQHLKGNQPPKSQPHSYQIPLPTSSIITSAPSVFKQSPLPVSTQSILSNVAPPVYSAIADKNVNKNTALGFQIEKSLSQSFSNGNDSANNSIGDLIQNKSNTSISSVDEHDPCPDFKPIIPLPDEVPLNTGEEDEIVMFCERAKLYRFVNKEWKERGVGLLKILRNPNTGKTRLLMRRDQVHKICANHFITWDMNLTTMATNDKAYIWAANDYADQEVVLEKFCVKFKTLKEATKFYEAFEKAKIYSKDDVKIETVSNKNKVTSTTTQVTASLGGFVFTNTPSFKPKEDIAKEIEQKSSPKVSPFASFTFGTKTSAMSLFDSKQTDFKPVQKPSEVSASPKGSSTTNDITASPVKDDSHAEEFVPTAEFKPVVPLPEVVDVKTGEENAEVLFESRAKLLRFDQTTKEWKERGVGTMKLLKETSTIRLLMRRDQVHKVCCNHQLLKNMNFEKMSKTPKAVSWYAQDFSEEVLKPELFAIRFKTEEQTENFIKAITNAQNMLNENNAITVIETKNENAKFKPNPKIENVETKSPSWGEKFKLKQSSWKCKICYIVNEFKDNHCAACGTSKSDSIQKSPLTGSSFNFTPVDNTTADNTKMSQKISGWGDAFKPKEGSWRCNQCYIENDANKSVCAACNSNKDGDKFIRTWTCKHCYAENDESSSVCHACGSCRDGETTKETSGINLETPGFKFNFGIVPSTESETSKSSKLPAAGFGDLFKPKANEWECKLCLVRNKSDLLYCSCCENPKDDSVPSKNTNLKGINLDTPGQKFNFGIASSTPNHTASISNSSAATFTFGSLAVKKSDSSSPATKGFNFSVTEKSSTEEKESESERSKFVFGSPQKHSFEFTPRSPRTQSCGHGEEDSENSYLEEECDNIYFKPVIPLPDKVDVKTGEEQEEILYCHRAKLFRFVQGEWKERGLGDIKILKHLETKKLRVVMRREQVLKICLNHALTSDIEYIAKDDKTWLFAAPDYSEGEIEHQKFCVRFKSPEVAQEFKNAIDKALSSTSQDKNSDVTQTDNDSDVEIISETKVTADEEKEAVRLGLPPKFFAYRQLPDCVCEQCEKDDKILEPLFKGGDQKSGSFVFHKTTSDGLPLQQKSFNFTPTTSTVQTSTTSESTLKKLLIKPPAFSNASLNQPVFNQFSFSKSNTDLADNSSPSNKNNSIDSFSVGSKSSIFGTPSSSETSIFSSGAGSIFGSCSSNVSTSASKVFSSASAGNIFASTTTPSSNVFGSSSVTSFGKLASNTGSVFSNSATNTVTSTVSPRSIFSTPTTSVTSNIFGGTVKSTTGGSLFSSATPVTSATGSIFGGGVKQQPTVFDFTKTKHEEKPKESKPDEVVFKCDPGLSFASLAANNSSTSPGFNAFGKSTEVDDKNAFAFLGSGAPVFKSTNVKQPQQQQKQEKASSGDEGEEGGNDDEYDPHYEPIVPLPAAIALSTGEEDENVLFNERAKLFRFDGNEWKERGVGQMKLLHHPVNNTYRLLLRREQVHKVVLNQLIIPDLSLHPLATSDKAWMWGGYNFTDDETSLEKLAARFKTPELAKQFYDAVQNAIAAVKEHQQNKSLPSFVQNFGVEDVSEEENIEYNNEEQDYEDDDDTEDDRTIMFAKPCTLSEKLESGEWSEVATGDLQVYYDPDIYGARISVNDESGQIVSNTIIGINTEMELDNNECIWCGIERINDLLDWRTLKATFSSDAAASEFFISYQEGVTYAQQCEIIDE